MTFLKIVNRFDKKRNMIRLKFELFSNGLVHGISRIIRKYIFKKQLLTIYDLLLVLIFLFIWLF